MIGVGEMAPSFTLVGADAGLIDTHSLAEYTDRGWTVVLTFSPSLPPGLYRPLVCVP